MSEIEGDESNLTDEKEIIKRSYCKICFEKYNDNNTSRCYQFKLFGRGIVTNERGTSNYERSV